MTRGQRFALALPYERAALRPLVGRAGIDLLDAIRAMTYGRARPVAGGVARSAAELAAETGVSVRTVERTLPVLVAVGVLGRVKHGPKGSSLAVLPTMPEDQLARAVADHRARIVAPAETSTLEAPVTGVPLALSGGESPPDLAEMCRRFGGDREPNSINARARILEPREEPREEPTPPNPPVATAPPEPVLRLVRGGVDLPSARTAKGERRSEGTEDEIRASLRALDAARGVIEKRHDVAFAAWQGAENPRPRVGLDPDPVWAAWQGRNHAKRDEIKAPDRATLDRLDAQGTQLRAKLAALEAEQRRELEEHEAREEAKRDAPIRAAVAAEKRRERFPGPIVDAAAEDLRAWIAAGNTARDPGAVLAKIARRLAADAPEDDETSYPGAIPARAVAGSLR